MRASWTSRLLLLGMAVVAAGGWACGATGSYRAVDLPAPPPV